jgi:hypothetical protein
MRPTCWRFAAAGRVSRAALRLLLDDPEPEVRRVAWERLAQDDFPEDS